MSNWNAVCDAIDARMAELGLTVEDVARETGLLRWTVRNLKACIFRDGQLDEFDEALKLPAGWLWHVAYGMPPGWPVLIPPPPGAMELPVLCRGLFSNSVPPS